MAVTKIWPVKIRLEQLVDYVSNEEKTTEVPKDEALDRVLHYDMNDSKTEQRRYVSGVNCEPSEAKEQMRELLSYSNSDRVAYHAYQSFAKGEVTPDQAHSIGVQLAQELWGKNFPVVVATHINTDAIHNHFCICATGFDTKRFHVEAKDYYRMQEVSDRLCRENGLSVIEQPQKKETKDIGEIKAEQEGRYTVRGQIRRDIDLAVSQRDSWKYFVPTFESLGYSMEYRGKYLRIRPDGSSKWFRMDKLGEGYTEADVKDRLIENYRSNRAKYFHPFTPDKREKPKGLRALYYYYQYLLGNLPRTKPVSRLAYDYLKEESRKARLYSQEATLLGQNHIDTADDLHDYTESISNQFKSLAIQRAGLRNKLRRMHDTETMQPIKDQITALSDQMAVLRKNMKLCEHIAECSGAVESVVNLIFDPNKEKEFMQEQKNKREEKTKANEHIR